MCVQARAARAPAQPAPLPLLACSPARRQPIRYCPLLSRVNALLPRAVIKKEFDKKYGPTWHVIVGRNFGSYVTRESAAPCRARVPPRRRRRAAVQ